MASTRPGGGRGLATRAVRLVSRYAAAEGGKEAVIRVEPENAASAAVAQRAGFAAGKHTHDEDRTRLDWYVRDLHIDAVTIPAPQAGLRAFW